MDFKHFDEEYNKNYLEKITYDFIRKTLGLDESVKIKRNGTFKRNLIFHTPFGLVIKRVKIQKFLVYDEFGVGHYLSVFPRFIIKYFPLSTGLLELVTRNVRKDEDILSHISDPDGLIDCEDPIARACANMEKRCISRGFTILLAQKLAVISNRLPDFGEEKTARYPNLFLLYRMGKALFCLDTGIFSTLNLNLGLY